MGHGFYSYVSLPEGILVASNRVSPNALDHQDRRPSLYLGPKKLVGLMKLYLPIVFSLYHIIFSLYFHVGNPIINLLFDALW